MKLQQNELRRNLGDDYPWIVPSQARIADYLGFSYCECVKPRKYMRLIKGNSCLNSFVSAQYMLKDVLLLECQLLSVNHLYRRQEDLGSPKCHLQKTIAN